MAIAWLLSLTICFALSSGCATHKETVVVTPSIPIPDRPWTLPVIWTHERDEQGDIVRSCIDTQNAKNLLNNWDRLDNYSGTLEAIIKASGQ
jgi:hypothetical protein